MQASDERYMRRAIELAEKASGWTNPNPMVGAVVVKDGRIIAEGYHEKCGSFHAERNALLHCKEDPEGATIYVTLEPCCHHGKTPPCTDIIIEKKLSRVVIGSRDPNPLVAGKGAAILRDHGIEVEEDFLREECDALNPVFFHYITSKLPYVVMKYAMTLDGKIASRSGASKWITGEEARAHVQKLRARYACILAGIGTVLADDPMLNCRIEGARQPLRIIVDSKLRIPMDSQIVRSARKYPTMVATAFTWVEHSEEKEKLLNNKKKDLEEAGVEVLELSTDQGGRVDLNELCKLLGERGLDSVLVEGGGEIHEAFRAAGLVQHVCAYVAPKIMGGKDAKTPVEGFGAENPEEALKLTHLRVNALGEDLLLEYDVKN